MEKDGINLSENYSIKKDNKNYEIILNYSESSIGINISFKDSSKTFSYIKYFTLNELIKVSNFFSLFKNISDIIPNIKKMISNTNSRDIQVEEVMIKLILIPPIENIDKIIFALPKADINKDDIIQELMKSNYNLTKRVENLEKEIINIKKIIEKEHENNINIYNYKNIIDSSIIYNYEETKFIVECLGKNNLKFNKLYKMSKDGESDIFHKKCDNKGPTLCLFKIKDKDIRYGGFTSVSWDITSKEKKDENAFIFSINNKKMFKTTNYNSSIYCNSGYGPFFGGNSSCSNAELWFCGNNNCGFYNNNVYKDLR